MSVRTIDDFVRWDPRTQRYITFNWRRQILPSWLTFSPTDTTLPLTVAAAPALTKLVSMVQPYTSVEGMDMNCGTPFEVRSLLFEDDTDGTANANFTVMMREMGEVRNFMNAPIHVRCMFGTGQFPAVLREPYMFLSQHNIQFQFQKISGGAINMRAYLAGAQYFTWASDLIKYPQAKQEIVTLIRKWQKRRQYITPFWLTPDTPGNVFNLVNGVQAGISVPAGSTVDCFTKIGDDGHFEAFGFTQVSTGNFNIEIMEVKTRQTLMNGSVTATNAGGDARLPMIFPSAYLFPAGMQLRFRITDQSGATNIVFPTLFGRKIYAPFVDVSKLQRFMNKIPVPTPADTPTPMVPKPLQMEIP